MAMAHGRREELKSFCTFALPGFLVFLAVVMAPFAYGAYLTFTDWDGVRAAKSLAGLRNYAAALADGAFWESLSLTLKYVLATTVIVNVAAFALAWLLTSGVPGQGFFRAGFFTPNLIGGVVLGFIWQFVFSQALPALGRALGAPALAASWLSDPGKAFWAMVIVTAWQYTGYMMLIYVAGFAGLPGDVMEAASIDGAAGVSRFARVTLPLLMPSVTVCLFLMLSRAFMVYDVNLSLTKGGPYGATEMAAMHVYEKAFTGRAYGTGQAEALVLFAVVAAAAGAQAWLGKRQEVEA